MPRARWLQSAAVVSAFTVVLTMAAPTGGAAPDTPPAPPNPPSPVALCNAISPVAFPCVGTGKFADAVAAECRRVGIPDRLCVLPLAHKVTQAARDAYLQSWVHRVAQFQYTLQDSLPFRDAQWIGTHNSFNSLAQSFTISHADSNQQLSLTQQLDIDVRSLEIDLHYMPRVERLGSPAVTVCHGLSPQLANLGCTVEPVFDKVLPEVANWLNTPEHAGEVVLILIDNLMENAKAYASAYATLEKVLRRPDGSSLIYRPDLSQRAANGCVPFPIGASRADVRAAGAQVVLVGGSCTPTWATAVFDWAGQEVQSGSTPDYQPYPACDATYGPPVYGSKVVRYYEDSTFVSALIDPTRPPNNPAALTPLKVQSMTNCGVNLFGLDQILPEDGRIQATLWSWAPDEPRAGAGNCTLQGTDSRWVAAPCGDAHPAACQSGAGTWTVTAPVNFATATAACTAMGSTFALPRTGDQNSNLHAVAQAVGGAWVQYTF